MLSALALRQARLTSPLWHFLQTSVLLSSVVDKSQAFGDKGKQPSMAGNSAGLASL